MKNSLLLLVIAATSIFITNIVHANNNFDLFIEGCHLDDPIPIPSDWNAIYTTKNKNNKSSKLLKADLLLSKKFANVDDFYDFCVKIKPNNAEKTYTTPIVLIKGSELKAGIINSASMSSNSFKEHQNRTFTGGEKIPETDESIKIKLGESEYILRQNTKLDDYATGNNHILTLYHSDVSQLIFNKRGNYEGETGFYIIWAGDIDNDNKLDLILNLPEHYASPYDLRLFLSSYASKGQLVKQVVERGFSSP